MKEGKKGNLSYIFDPASIAVIGASKQTMKWGFIVPANIVAGGWKGELYPINPHEEEILSRKVYRSIKEVPGDVDLAVVTVPAQKVVPLVRECVEKGVKGCIVISGGFSETGEDGALLEKELLSVVSSSEMRLVGPNTMGVFSAPNSLHCLMPPVRPLKGKIAFAAQSGNLGTQMLSLGSALGVGFSRFVSIGNEADLKWADYIEYFGNDPQTGVILLYMEGVRDARKFIEVASRTSSKKPIVVKKAGRTKSGAKAAKSHSAALAADEVIFDGVIKQTGMVEVDTTEEMLDVAKAFAVLPLPKGKRVGVLTWGGGWGVVAADALEQHGLELVELPEETLKELDEFLPPYWSRGNPVDLVGTLDLSQHFRCSEILARCPVVDAVISLGTMGATTSFQSFVEDSPALEKELELSAGFDAAASEEFVRQLAATEEAYRNEVVKLVNETNKPIVVVAFPSPEDGGSRLASHSDVVVYPSPERGAKALAALYEYKKYLQSLE
ncbi:MAG: CoA-binding protein [Actinomycetota bacterium]|nr:CoA-binding protein [Actinomycetota bacterium]